MNQYSVIRSTDSAVVQSQENAKGSANARTATGSRFLEWPISGWLFLAAVAVLYWPALADAAQQWMTNDSYAHGIFIFPLAAGILWMRKSEMSAAVPKPDTRGLWLIAIGVTVQTCSYLLRIKYLGMWSLIPTLAGGILLLHGHAMWKIARFSVLFLLFAAPFPHSLLTWMTGRIESFSTVGAFTLMTTLGYTLLKHGNLIQLPGATLEVADACSGFHKLISLLAFATLYGYLYTMPLIKRALLIAAAIPVALFANVLRISGLIAVASSGGIKAVHMAHDGAELFVIVIAFAAFVLIGKGLGCKTPRFLPPLAS